MTTDRFSMGASRAPGSPLRCVAAALLAAASLSGLAACGGGDGGSGAGPAPAAGPVAATVTVTPASATVTTAQPLTVAVVVGGAASTPSPDGMVTLTSGGFSSGPVAVSSGKATVTIPAGVLAANSPAGGTSGPATLSVQYAPSTAAASAYLAGAGAATVTVSDSPAPSVTATSTPVPTNGHPFMALPVGANVLVSVTQNPNFNGSVTGLRVYSAPTPGALSYVCTQTASHPNHQGLPFAFGLAALPNGLDLALAVDDAGLDLLSQPAVLGGCRSGETLVPQGSIPGADNSPPGQGSFAVAVTADGKYAFVANEYGVAAAGIEGNVGVVRLSYDSSGHVASGVLVGQISTGGSAIANVTLSPDGSRLYVTSEVVSPSTTPAGATNTLLAHGGCSQGPSVPLSSYGLLSVIDVAKAEAAPSGAAIIATVASGCSPVRVVETADQQVVWVAARGDNRVLAFSTHMLESDPGSALLGYGDTGGIAPVGLQLFHGGQLLAVANSNRFATPDIGNMTIMRAVPVRPVVVQTVPATNFPRSITVAADDATLYLTDYDDSMLQVIATSVH